MEVVDAVLTAVKRHNKNTTVAQYGCLALDNLAQRSGVVNTQNTHAQKYCIYALISSTLYFLAHHNETTLCYCDDTYPPSLLAFIQKSHVSILHIKTDAS